MTQPFAPVPLSKAFRLINHGPAVLVSARHQGVSNVMAAAWACALDYAPPKLTVVLDKAARTRELIEKSGYFVIQIPTAAQIELTYDLSISTFFAVLLLFSDTFFKSSCILSHG